MATTRNSDFDPNALTQKTDEHTKILSELQQRVGTNENFGKTFKKAAADSKAIDEAVEASVIKLLKDNTNAQDAVTDIVSKVDGRENRKQLLGLGKLALWVLSLVMTAVVTAVITNALSSDTSDIQTSTTQTSQQKQ